jgi:hypothetical protein
MSNRDLLPNPDWYTEMERDAAFLGDLESEKRRFDHETHKNDLPLNISAWMRQQLDNPTPEQIAKRKRLADLFDSFDAQWTAEKEHPATSLAVGTDAT